MEAAAALERLGGVGSARQIVALSSRRKLRTATAHGEITRVERGRYVLAAVHHHRLVARQLAGVTSHLSAAQHWGWKVKWAPSRPWVTVRRNRNLDADTRARVHIAYADLGPEEIREGVTSPLRTVLDCSRRLPFDEALAVADSALRSGDVTKEELVAAATLTRGRGAPECRAVAAAASGDAANPFESVLRALVLEVRELQVVPQLPVTARGVTWHPDLVDESRRVAIEADSWEFHVGKEAHSRDCVRYTALTLAGWLVIRFTWEQVMLSPAYVRSVLTELAQITGCEHAAA